MPGHVPITLRTSESPLDHTALSDGIFALIRNEYDLHMTLNASKNAAGFTLYLDKTKVEAEVTISDGPRLTLWFEPSVIERMNYINAQFGEPFDLEFENCFLDFCVRIATAALVGAFSLTMGDAPAPFPTIAAVQTIMRGEFGRPAEPPRLPPLVGVREDYISLEEAITEWDDAVYKFGSYVIWDTFRPIAEPAEAT
jgi:hypothetical protein